MTVRGFLMISAAAVGGAVMHPPLYPFGILLLAVALVMVQEKR